LGYDGVEAKIPLGEIGLLTDVSPTDMPPNALTYANNICLWNGCVEKAPGTLKFNASALPAGIVAIHDWWPDTTKQRLIAVTSAGSVYRDTGGRDFASNTAITTGLGTLTPNCKFTEGGVETAGRSKKLFLFTNGVAQLKVLEADGTSFASIDNPAADWTGTNYPKCGVVHRNRLWAFAGQRAYASDTGDQENFTTNYLTQAVFPGEGGEIRGAYVYKGRLFAFKDGGFVYYLEDSDSDSAFWFWKKLASSFGLAAPNALQEVGNDLIGGNTTGTITSYAASDALGEVESADIMQLAKMESFLRATTSKSGILEQHCLYYPEKKTLFATYRSTYRTYNDMLISLDTNTGQPRFAFWIKGYPQCLALRKDINEIFRPMYGDKDGYVHIMDYEDRLEGSTAFLGDFQTAQLDFSHVDPRFSTTNKLFDHLSVHYLKEGSHNLSCDYFIDGKYVETITFPMQQYDNAQLNQLVLDTDRLAQFNQETFTRPLKGSGRTISFRFYNNGSNQSFRIAAITVGFRPSGKQAQKAT